MIKFGRLYRTTMHKATFSMPSMDGSGMLGSYVSEVINPKELVIPLLRQIDLNCNNLIWLFFLGVEYRWFQREFWVPFRDDVDGAQAEYFLAEL